MMLSGTVSIIKTLRLAMFYELLNRLSKLLVLMRASLLALAKSF